MGRLFDADVLIKNLDDAIQDAKRNGEICDYWEDDRSNLLYYLDTAPTVDAVEVVRCGNCKHNYGIANDCSFNEDDIVCTYWESDGLTSDDFCSHGERRKR